MDVITIYLKYGMKKGESVFSHKCYRWLLNNLERTTKWRIKKLWERNEMNESCQLFVRLFMIDVCLKRKKFDCMMTDQLCWFLSFVNKGKRHKYTDFLSFSSTPTHAHTHKT